VAVAVAVTVERTAGRRKTVLLLAMNLVLVLGVLLERVS
jgi:hypothetical protein